MKKLTYLMACGLACAWTVQADPILLNTLPLPGSQPASQGQQAVADWLDGLLGPGDQIGAAAAVSVDKGGSAPSGFPAFGNGKNPILLPTGGYDFLVLHWGGPGGGKDYAFDLRNCPTSSDWTFSNPVGSNGLSSYRYYNPRQPVSTPDSGSVALLMAFTLGGLSFVRRKLS